MTTLELIFAIFDGVFGLISTVCAIIQTISKNKYKKLCNKQVADAGDGATISQIGGIIIDKKQGNYWE